MTENAFDHLGIPPQFHQDAGELRSRYLRASAEVHPDRFTDPLEQADAAERSAQLNAAYQTLTDPERRANALLAVLGGPAKEADPSLPPDLLMEMMEARQELEEAIAGGDHPTIDKFRVWATEQRGAHLNKVSELFDQAQAAPEADRSPTLKAIRLELNALRYFERMLHQMP